MKQSKIEFDIRYIVRGLVDGSLSVLGIIIGASGASPEIILTAGMGGGVANGFSNIFGAFTAEKAKLEKKLSELERAMLKDSLKGTHIHEKAKKMMIAGGISDGVFTIIGSTIPLLPFILVYLFKHSKEIALVSSIILTIAILFILGVYVGKLSKENVAIMGAKMAMMGIVTAIVCKAIESSFRGIFN